MARRPERVVGRKKGCMSRRGSMSTPHANLHDSASPQRYVQAAPQCPHHAQCTVHIIWKVLHSSPRTSTRRQFQCRSRGMRRQEERQPIDVPDGHGIRSTGRKEHLESDRFDVRRKSSRRLDNRCPSFITYPPIGLSTQKGLRVDLVQAGCVNWSGQTAAKS